MKTSHFLVPSLEEVSSIIDLQLDETDLNIFKTSLLNPLDEFLGSDGKKFRSDIIDIGFEFGKGVRNEEAERKLQLCAHIIEGLHAGSMIIDDIQDQSEFRRGKTALHRKYGVAVALNAGNWLYFQAIHLLKDLGFEPHAELHLHRYINKILLRAHFGQAADVGTSMSFLPQSQASSISLAAMELKTGALMSLGFDLGAFVANQALLPSADGSRFAKEFGIALQMFDDIGNLSAPPPKGREDLRKGRPSFIWAVASEISNERDYSHFIQAAEKLPDDSFLNSWVGLFNLSGVAKERASKYLWQLLEKYPFDSSLKERLSRLFSKLERAYV